MSHHAVYIKKPNTELTYRRRGAWLRLKWFLYSYFIQKLMNELAGEIKNQRHLLTHGQILPVAYYSKRSILIWNGVKLELIKPNQPP